MVRRETLDRVDADLERGHTYLALQRLASLAALYPGSLEIRRRRAAISRQIGNFAEAGRWGFLTEGATATEIAAFENAFKQPSHQLSALKLACPPQDLGPVAQSRFEALAQRVEEESRETRVCPDVPLETTSWLGRVTSIGCGVIAVAGFLTLIFFAVYGYMSVFDLF